MESRKKVLLVDDVKLFLEMTRSFFSRENFQITVAGSGTEALQVLKPLRPNLVIVDLHMPEIDGAEVCRRIKADPDLSSIPVIMVTGSETEEDRRRCSEAGCDALLSRPLNRRLLLNTTRQFLEVAERVAPRVRTRMLVHYGVENRKTLHDYSVNLGAGGVFLETTRLLPVETPVTLEFFIPGLPESLTCKGKVAWVNPPRSKVKPELPVGIGIVFVDLSPRDGESIQEFVRQEGLEGGCL